jgi:hypothetical protein
MEPYTERSSIGQKGLFGRIVEIHDFHQGTPYYFNRLGKCQACNNRQNYYIVI